MKVARSPARNMSDITVDQDIDMLTTYQIKRLATPVSGEALKKGYAGIVHGDIATANKDGGVGTPSMRTLGSGAQQASAGDHTHTLVAEAESATFTTLEPDSYDSAGSRPKKTISGSGDIDPFVTNTDTFSALSRAVAAFGGILGANEAGVLKARLHMGGVQVAESAYFEVAPSPVSLLGNRSLSGSQPIKVTVHNYNVGPRDLQWYSKGNSTNAMNPLLVVGSVTV